MPFLQIALEQDLNEHEARLALDYIREHFPLRQSESRLYREASDFLLFEQPEHDILTFEQGLWLEQYKQAAHIWYTRFYASEAERCYLCGDPFDSSPTGYCPRCGPTNPRETTSILFSLTQAGHAYLTYLSRYVRGEREAPYLRSVIQTFLSLFDAGLITSEVLLATRPTQFEERAWAFFQKQQTTCSLCGLSDEQCTCPHSSFAHPFRLFENLFEREYVVTIPLPHKDASSLQAFADQYALMVDTLIDILIETPTIQVALYAEYP
ncbi:MAG TPA: hypothetical protein VN729_13330 [Ktedonobacteraceae bacterium]|nr:hypothetical protein [Ktedonobacteraceae bacterium]